MKIDAVFEGGGVKGIGLVGAVCCLEDNGYEIENFAGTSAGAFVASLLAAGYTGKELKKIVENLNYEKFLDKNFLDKFKITSILRKGVSLIGKKGIYSGDAIEEFIRNMLKVKGKTKFKDISKNGKSPLKIIASDITRERMLVLPDDIREYGINPMEFEIAKAVRMSISIPLFFTPVKVNCKNKVCYIVDGGILSNYPIWIFDVEGTPKWPTFGFKFTNDTNKIRKRNIIIEDIKNKNTIIHYLVNVIRAMLSKNEELYVTNKDWVRTIGIPTLGVETTEFSISSKKSCELFKMGYKSAEKFLNNWDFRNYKDVYRKYSKGKSAV